MRLARVVLPGRLVEERGVRAGLLHGIPGHQLLPGGLVVLLPLLLHLLAVQVAQVRIRVAQVVREQLRLPWGILLPEGARAVLVAPMVSAALGV